ncbi:hypothetical protein E2C01_058872 [Portunus trituberculatus]|uniref:Uncharacterized protein n=1 Tax=Portunus trituberculatus TaxID=210409 RepID=A0A5B7H104_PORTR|nr:hypothetical protein [Portunus trituberculatus]
MSFSLVRCVIWRVWVRAGDLRPS